MTSHLCPTVVWCGVNIHIDICIDIMNSVMNNVQDENIYFDAFVVGNIGKVVHIFQNHTKLRKVTCIALQEEKPNKKIYTILEGYDFSHDMTVMDYFITLMNRVTNIRLDESRKKSFLM